MATTKKTAAKSPAKKAAPAKKADSAKKVTAAKKAAPAKKADSAKKVTATKKAAPKKAAATKKATTKLVVKKTPAKKTTAKRTPNAAFMKPVTPSAALSAVIGATSIPRTEVTKKIWDYIKAKNLQDPNNRRMINADDKLKPIFGGKKQVSMFELTKLVSNNLS